MAAEPIGAAPPPDHVPLALTGLAAGVASGTAVVVTAFWIVRMLQVGAAPAATPDLSSPAAAVFLVGSLGGVLTGAMVTWTLLAPIASTYRQGGISLVAAFATVVAATVVGFPTDLLIGRWGLLTAGLLMGLLAVRLRATARRVGRPG